MFTRENFQEKKGLLQQIRPEKLDRARSDCSSLLKLFALVFRAGSCLAIRLISLFEWIPLNGNRVTRNSQMLRDFREEDVTRIV